MSEGYGYFVIRRGIPHSVPFAAGQVVDVYPLAAPLDLSSVGPLPAGARTEDVHALAHRYGPEIQHADKESRREIKNSSLHCDCPTTPRLVAVYVYRGMVWVVVRREKVPAEFRSPDRHATPSAWPLHNEPNGAPHVELTTCGTCRKAWAVAITEGGATLVDLARPLYSRRVGP